MNNNSGVTWDYGYRLLIILVVLFFGYGIGNNHGIHEGIEVTLKYNGLCKQAQQLPTPEPGPTPSSPN